MVYLLDKFDLGLLNPNMGGDFMNFTMWETTGDRVERMLANERCKSIFSRQEIMSLFKTGKIQMVKCTDIKLKAFDRVIIWTEDSRYFVIELTGFEKCK